MESVSIRLDLEDSMLLYGVSIQFMESEDKPDSIIFERSVDFGSRFRSYHYAARDCEDVFSMASGERTAAKDIVCETMNGTTKNIHFKVIPEDDQSPIDEQFYFSKITNLRINLTDFGKQSNRKSYRISKIRVYGSCLCYGHANQCVTGSDGRITPTCLCQHNTNGTNCEICQELYNDRPWSIALEKEKNECIKCNCSDRAESCIFDPQVYETSGKKSGGVCLGCTNSTGFACQTCRSFYYADGNACRPCGCSDVGSLSNLCDGKTGQCDCLPRYSGRDCATRSPS